VTQRIAVRDDRRVGDGEQLLVRMNDDRETLVMRGRAAVVGVVGALLLLGCGRGGSTSAASDRSAAEGLLQTYIAAVNSGDVAGAMSQRCRPAQIPEADDLGSCDVLKPPGARSVRGHRRT